MFCAYFVFVLLPAPLTLGVMSLQIDGKIDLGPRWNYEYRINHFTTSEPIDRPYIIFDEKRMTNGPETEVTGSKLIDIIIKNDECNSDLVQTAETHFKDDVYKKNDEKKGVSVKENHTKPVQNVDTRSFKFTIIDQYIETLERRPKHHRPNKENTHKNNHKRHENKTDNIVRFGKEPIHLDANVTDLLKIPASKEHIKSTHSSDSQKHKTQSDTRKDSVETRNKLNQRLHVDKSKTTANAITLEEFTKPVTSMVDSVSYKSKYIEPQLVKDDPKIKEFTRHVYEQSIKVFDNIKQKMTNYDMKKEVDHLKRSYEDKFGEFVRETQNQKIKTRLGKQKVILNTFDTSNRILERLVNYLIGKMDYKGVLRNDGGENVLHNEIQKKMELENKHICKKLQICRSQESYSKFITNVLNIILSTNDAKVTMAKDAVTEVLKETDFSHAMDADTEKRFRKGIQDLEKYDVYTMRPLFFIMKNLVENKNAPIKVVGPEDSRVNKTIAFLDIIDTWEQKLPPNENNVLEWADMTNSFRDWSEGKRKDIKDLMQGFTDHVLKVINSFDRDEAKSFERNINIMLGY